jgi:hypothetical protein
LDVIATQIPRFVVWADDDTVTPVVLSRIPLTMGHMGFAKEGWQPQYGIELSRLLNWAGVSYWLSTANGEAESSKTIAGWLGQGRIPLTGHDDGWVQLSGYRKAGRGALVHSLRPDTTVWHEYSGSWGRLPGRVWVEIPVLVVNGTHEPLAYSAWIDSFAIAVLELARTQRTEQDESWGKRGCPAGVAGWDAWVFDWERQPWTTQWARTDEGSDNLGRMGRGYYEGRSRDRNQGAEFFARAAEHSEGDRQRLLTEASKGYATASQVMLQIHERLPKSRSGELPVEDSLLQVGIASLRPLARLVRAAERQALAALVQLVDADPLPTMQEDPLLRRDRGRVLYRWQADFSKGVYDLTLTNEQFTRTIVDGRDTEGEQFDVEHGVRHEPEWVAVLEIVDGGGLYHIAQQANADNDWTLVVRVDDESTPYDNSTEIVIWEVPAE